MQEGPSAPDLPPRTGAFATTHWTMILTAGKVAQGEANPAMTALCERYWYPVYAFVRRRCGDPHNALDLTQGFFTRLLEKQDLAGVERGHGRFRAWLLTAVQHYLANEHDRARAEKRGGGQVPLSINGADAESRYLLEPFHEFTAERIFERRWALSILGQTLAALRREYESEGKQRLFDALKDYLGGKREVGGYRRISEELGMSEGAVWTAAYRLRQRYGELLRGRIAETVETPEQGEEEIDFLIRAVG
jgi:DNA-directed RNA polymerase specialized sigma24 family protein